jgi:ribosomal protein S12 methylthiotransferase
VKQERYERLMRLQQPISLERNQAFVGRTLDVLFEGKDKGISIGRSYRDAPEIDGLVLVEDDIPAGQMVKVRINGAMAYDLTGTVANTVNPVATGLIDLEAIGARRQPKQPL